MKCSILVYLRDRLPAKTTIRPSGLWAGASFNLSLLWLDRTVETNNLSGNQAWSEYVVFEYLVLDILTETMDQLSTLKRKYKRITKIRDAQYMWYRQHYECVRQKFQCSEKCNNTANQIMLK